MAVSDKSVKVTVTANVVPYKKGLAEASAATDKLGRDLDGISAKSKGMDSSLSKSVGSVKGLGIAAGAVAGTALVSFLTDSVKAAGDLQQSIGGVDAVFKESAQTIHDFGQNSAEAVGLSTNEFNQLITVTGAMLKNKGLEDFAQKSLDLVQIGADLSATYGGTAKDAIDALNAALRGESDPIERYGITLNETAVNAELMAKGLTGLTGAALDQAKAQARIEIITRQSADALGAYAREADTAQGQQQRLNKEWENAQAQLGQALLPALTKVAEALRGGLDLAVAAAGAFDKIPGPVKAAVVGLTALHLLRGPLGNMLSGTIGQVKELSATLKGGGGIAAGAKAAGGALMGAFGGPLGIAVGLGAAALTAWWQEAEKTNAIAEQLKGTIDKTTGAFTSQSKATIKETLLGDLSTDDIKRMQELGVNFDALAEAALQGGPALAKAQQELDGLKDFDLLFMKDDADVLDALQSSLGRAGDAAERSKVIFGETATEVAKSGDAADLVREAIDKATTATTSNTTANLNAVAAIRGVADASLIAADAAVAEVKAQEHAAAAMDAHVSALQTIRQSLADAGDATDELTQLVQDRAQKQADATKSTKDGWEDYAEGVKLSAKDVIKTLEEQTAAAKNWRDNLLIVQKQGDEQFTAWVAQQPAQVAQAYASGTAKEKQAIYNAYKENVGAQQALGIADGLAAGEHTVTDAAGNVYTATKDKLTGQTILIPVGVKSPSETVLKSVASSIVKGIGTLKIPTVPQIVTPRLPGYRVTAVSPLNHKDGGYVRGPGTTTSDSIPAYLSDKEYVIKAAAVQKYGRGMFDRLNSMRFAEGGFVSRMPQRVSVAQPTAVSSGDSVTINAYNSGEDAIQRGIRDYFWQRDRS